jgi:hypothetical protein
MTFDYLDKPVMEFLEYLKNEYRVDPLEDVIYIGKDDSLRDVIQRFVFAKGHTIYVSEERVIRTILTTNDIIEYFLS